MGVVEAARVAQGPRHWFPRLPVGRITPDRTGVIQESPNPLEVLSHRASGGRAACRYSILDCVSDWATNRIWNSVPTIAQCWIVVAAIYYAIDLARQTRVGWSDGAGRPFCDDFVLRGHRRRLRHQVMAAGRSGSSAQCDGQRRDLPGNALPAGLRSRRRRLCRGLAAGGSGRFA